MIMTPDSLRYELLGLAEGLPFALFVSGVVNVPEIDPDWEEPEDFDWETGEAPIVGYVDIISVGWKWNYKGEKYGSYVYVRCESTPSEILDRVIENFEHSKDAIKEGTWTAQ